MYRQQYYWWRRRLPALERQREDRVFRIVWNQMLSDIYNSLDFVWYDDCFEKSKTNT